MLRVPSLTQIPTATTTNIFNCNCNCISIINISSKWNDLLQLRLGNEVSNISVQVGAMPPLTSFYLLPACCSIQLMETCGKFEDPVQKCLNMCKFLKMSTENNWSWVEASKINWFPQMCNICFKLMCRWRSRKLFYTFW